MRTGNRNQRGGNSNLETTVGNDVDLNVYPAAIVFDKLVGVTGVTVHIVDTIWGTAIREQDEDLVSRLWVLYKIVL